MKKTVFAMLVLLVTGFVVKAQVKPHAIGARLGGGAEFGLEASYQQGLGNSNRLELDLGLGGNSDYSRIGLAGIYHWVWNIDGGFNWYVGPGAGLSFSTGKGSHDDYFGLAIGGQIGMEYNFNIPLQLSIDTRPMWDFLADSDGFGWGICLGVRYVF